MFDKQSLMSVLQQYEWKYENSLYENDSFMESKKTHVFIELFLVRKINILAFIWLDLIFPTHSSWGLAPYIFIVTALIL